jgi:tyrosine-protein phosphatase YwqE
MNTSMNGATSAFATIFLFKQSSLLAVLSYVSTLFGAYQQTACILRLKQSEGFIPLIKKAENQQNLSINFKLLQKYVTNDMTMWLTASKREQFFTKI